MFTRITYKISGHKQEEILGLNSQPNAKYSIKFDHKLPALGSYFLNTTNIKFVEPTYNCDLLQCCNKLANYSIRFICLRSNFLHILDCIEMYILFDIF